MKNHPLNLGVISNPLSGGNRKGLGAIRRIVAAHRIIHGEGKTPVHISRTLSDFAEQGVTVVAVNGGDGTIQAVLTSLFHDKPYDRLPLLALLRSGTSSMTAGDVGLWGSGPNALDRLIRWAGTGAGGRLVERPVLRVRAPGHGPLYGMFFGAAAVCQGIRFFHERANAAGFRGELIPGLVIARFLMAAARRGSRFLKPSSVTVAINRSYPEDLDCLLILASTLERLFLGIRPFWNGGMGPLHFSAVTSNHRYLWRALPALLQGRRGRYGMATNGYVSHDVNELSLAMDGEFALDGELYLPATKKIPVLLDTAGHASFVLV